MMAPSSPLLRGASLLLTTAALTSCTLLSTKREAGAITEIADRYAGARPQAAARSPVRVADTPYFGNEVRRSGHGDPLPANVTALRLTVRRSDPIGLAEFAGALSQSAAHLPIRVEGGAGVSPPNTTMSGDPATAALLAHANAAPGLPAPGPMNSSGSTPPASGDDDAFVPDYRDVPLETILDDLAQRFDCEWSYANGAITIARSVTRVFEVRADPSVKQITSEVSGATPSPAQSGSGSGGSTSGSTGGSGGGDGSDSSSQQTSTKIELDVWKEIDSTLAALVPAPGRFVTQRAAGVVTVVASPATMRRAAAYFAALNKTLAARIAVEITAIYITADRSDDFGMSLNALYKDAKTGLTYGLADVVPSFSGTIGAASFAVSNPTSEVSGSSAVIKALATNNRLADVQTGSIITQNGVPSSLKLTTNTDIIRSVQFNTVAQAGAATTAAQATTIPTGFSLQILPRIVGNSDISLIASVENSAIASETQQSVGEGASLDLLTTTERNFSINVVVGSGEQIASLGYDQYTARRQQSGLGWFANLFDGEQRADLVRTRLLLILRAVILKAPMPQTGNQPAATADLFHAHDFQGE